MVPHTNWATASRGYTRAEVGLQFGLNSIHFGCSQCSRIPVSSRTLLGERPARSLLTITVVSRIPPAASSATELDAEEDGGPSSSLLHDEVASCSEAHSVEQDSPSEWSSSSSVDGSSLFLSRIRPRSKRHYAQLLEGPKTASARPPQKFSEKGFRRGVCNHTAPERGPRDHSPQTGRATPPTRRTRRVDTPRQHDPEVLSPASISARRADAVMLNSVGTTYEVLHACVFSDSCAFSARARFFD